MNFVWKQILTTALLTMFVQACSKDEPPAESNDGDGAPNYAALGSKIGGSFGIRVGRKRLVFRCDLQNSPCRLF